MTSRQTLQSLMAQTSSYVRSNNTPNNDREVESFRGRISLASLLGLYGDLGAYRRYLEA